jgi:hypothetical protein
MITVTDTGNEAVVGPLKIWVTPSVDGVSLQPAAIASMSRFAVIGPNNCKTYTLRFNPSGQVAAGTYCPFIAASLDGFAATVVGPVQFAVE